MCTKPMTVAERKMVLEAQLAKHKKQAAASSESDSLIMVTRFTQPKRRASLPSSSNSSKPWVSTTRRRGLGSLVNSSKSSPPTPSGNTVTQAKIASNSKSVEKASKLASNNSAKSVAKSIEKPPLEPRSIVKGKDIQVCKETRKQTHKSAIKPTTQADKDLVIKPTSTPKKTQKKEKVKAEAKPKKFYNIMSDNEEERQAALEEKMADHIEALVSSDTIECDSNPDFDAYLETRRAERKVAMEAKLAAREERRLALEEQLYANKAVRMGEELLETNNWFSPEFRYRTEQVKKLEEASKAKMDEHKKTLNKAVDFMKARIAKTNELTQESHEEHAAKLAGIEAEKERVKAEKAAKKIEDKQKKEAYEQRRDHRRSSLTINVGGRQM